jgi:HNH endonuclease
MAEIDSKSLHEMFEYRDGLLLWKTDRARRKVRAGDEASHIKATGYKYTCFNYKQYRTHRLIYCMFHGFMPEYIDHIDGNKLNNKIENLRGCTKAQNSYNRKAPKTNSSGHKNVCFYKRYNKWRSYIDVHGKKITGGYFDTIEDAVISATNLRQQHHGEFANHG